MGMANMIYHVPQGEVTSEGAQDIHQAALALLNLLNEIIESPQLDLGNSTHKNLLTNYGGLKYCSLPALEATTQALQQAIRAKQHDEVDILLSQFIEQIDAVLELKYNPQ